MKNFIKKLFGTLVKVEKENPVLTEREIECIRWCVPADASDWELEHAKMASLTSHGR